MEPRKVWIYALVDPRDKLVKYIGQSVNPASRYSAHMSGSYTSSQFVGDWCAELKSQSLKPVMITLEITNQFEAGLAEWKWLNVFKEANAPLLNKRIFKDTREFKRNGESS